MLNFHFPTIPSVLNLSSHLRPLLGSLLALLLMTGCFGKGISETDGGSSGGGGGGEETIGSDIQGTFVDAPVVGLGYSVASGSAETNSSGKFTCSLGETITFKIGNMVVGQAACSPVIFPMHLTGETTANSNGGAVAMGVLFKLLDNSSASGVYTIPPAVRNLNLSGTINFSSFNSDSDLGTYKTLIDEINTGASLSIDSATVQNNYDSTLAPAAAAELESNLVNPVYVSTPGNIADFVGKYFLATATRISGDNALCTNSNSLNFGLAVESGGTIGTYGSLGSGGTTGVSYNISVYRATTTDLYYPHVGWSLVTSGSTSVRTWDTFISGMTGAKEGNIFLKLGSDGSVKGSLKITGTSLGTEACIYDFTSVEDSAPLSQNIAALFFHNSIATSNFGSVSVGATLDRTLTMTNSGSGNASDIVGTGLSGAYSFKDGAFPGTGGTCGSTLAAGASCTIVATFAPTSSGLQTDSIEISYNNGDVTLNSVRAVRSLRGFAGSITTVANLVFEPAASMSFGSVAVGTFTQSLFKVKNIGGQIASSLGGAGLAPPFSFAGGSYPGVGGTCGLTLNPGSQCFLNIRFNPTVATSSSDTVDLNYNNGSGMTVASRAMTGFGAVSTSASLAFSPSGVVSVGTVAVGGSKDQVFSLSNTGTSTAGSMSVSALLPPFSFKGGTFPGIGGTCSSSLASGTSCLIVTRFAPTTASLSSGSFGISYLHGTISSSVSVSLTGNGVAPSSLSLSNSPSYSFGSVAVSSTADHSFVLTNSGSGTASNIWGYGLSAPFAFAGGAFPGTGGSCTSSLAAGQSCTIVGRFSPTANGTFLNNLSVSFSSGGSFNISRSLSGVGYGAPSAGTTNISISDGPTYSFGSLAVGGSLDKTFVVTNTGSLGASALAGSGLAAPFTFKGGSYPGAGGSCGTILASGANCNMIVNFAPVSTGSFADSIQLSFYNGSNTVIAGRALSGFGTAVSGGGTTVLSISDGPTYGFGSLAVGSNLDKTFVVSNSGSVGVSALSGSGLAAPFSFKGGSYPGAGGSCGTLLSAGANCNLVVNFAPVSAGGFSDSIDLNYFNGAGTVSTSRALTGSGTAVSGGGSVAVLQFVTGGGSYSFGTIAQSTVAEGTMSIVNVSGGSMATSMAGVNPPSPFAFKGGSFPGTGGSCTVFLASGGTCSVVMTYSPGTTGFSSGTMGVSYFNGSATTNLFRSLFGVAN